ncbi:MAG: prolipoprotein diacylglyceryl transferase [Candidatus Promineifilaceae bacterium]
MFPLLQLGPVALQVPGLILLAGLWIGLNVSEKEAVRQKRPSDIVYGLVMAAITGGILGARLWYVGRYLDTYLADPLGIIALDTNTLDATAGLLIGLLAAAAYGLRKKLPLRPTLDILTPGLAVFAIALGLAHLASGDAFGAPTNLPWAIELWDASRHPTQVYEMVLATAVFLLIWKARKSSPFPGFLFLAFVALTAVSRLFLEAFRGDSVLVAGGIRQAQLAALLVLLAALWLMRQWFPPVSHTWHDQIRPNGAGNQ